MLVLNQEYRPVDRIASFVWHRMDHERMTTFVYLLGKLVAYLPSNQRCYYNWLLIITYRPSQHISARQFSPAHLRLVVGARWELGFILDNWLLGLRLHQPLVWVKRLHTA